MNIQEATPIVLSDQERSALEAMIRSPKTEHGTVERARIVLLAAEGRSTRSIAAELGTWPGRVSRWRKRFSRERLAGLHELPRPGATPRYGIETDKHILAMLDQPPPAGYGSLDGAAAVARTWRRVGPVHLALLTFGQSMEQMKNIMQRGTIGGLNAKVQARNFL
jgi:transposase-like protein